MAAVSHVQLLRGNTAACSAYTPLVGEAVYDLEKKTVRVGDGITAGGTVLAKENIKLKTDTDALLKFNATTEADHSADVSITLDKPLVAGAVVTAIAADKPVKGVALATALISSKADNALGRATGTGEDGLLYVAPADSAEDLVASGEKLIYVNTDKKLATNVQLSIDTATNTLKMKSGADGSVDVASVQLPSSGILKSAEVVTEKPGGEGQPIEVGMFLKLVFELATGAEQTVYIDVAKLVDIYTASNGIKATGTGERNFELNTATTEPVMVNGSGHVTLRLGDGLQNSSGSLKVMLATSDNQITVDPYGALKVPCDYGTL